LRLLSKITNKAQSKLIFCYTYFENLGLSTRKEIDCRKFNSFEEGKKEKQSISELLSLEVRVKGTNPHAVRHPAQAGRGCQLNVCDKVIN